MSRIMTASGDLTTEVIATNIEIQYNPAAQDGTILFRMEKFATMNGQVVAREPAGMLAKTISSLMPRSFDVETGPGTTTSVPVALMMGLIKAAFDELYTESITPPADPPPTP